MPKIKLLVVDDSLFFRTSLQQKLLSHPSIEVVGTACNAAEASNKINLLRPDVMTLDVEMPGINGIDFLRKLLPVRPLPVVIVSSMPIQVLDALSAGAVDFVRKPEFTSTDVFASFAAELAQIVQGAATANVKARPVLSASPAQGFSVVPMQLNPPVIAIGASTGGTEAILSVVRDLPESTPGIVVVQHMPPVFTNLYAERLNRICKMRVVEAVHGARVERGKIIIAAGDYHLRLARDAEGLYVSSQRGAKVSGHCPSVDVLFSSVADVAKKNAMGIILTGMGSDGANGLLKMRQMGAYTVGQNQESCVVYGMPMVANNLGAVAKQLHLDQIGKEIISYASRK